MRRSRGTLPYLSWLGLLGEGRARAPLARPDGSRSDSRSGLSPAELDLTDGRLTRREACMPGPRP